jgi:phosphatidylglycerol:prolipoprotein diacylglycerol transferase
MHGLLFELFGVPFPSYFVLLLTGFLFATVIGALWAKRVGLNPDVIVDLGLVTLMAGVAGARLLHVFADGYFWDYVHLCTDPSQVSWPITIQECMRVPDNDVVSEWLGCAALGPVGTWDAIAGVCRPRHADCWAWARFYEGGLAYYGGLVTASIAAWVLLRADKFPFWKAADMAAMVIPLGLGFGRMGCLLAGCCFGRPWEAPFAIGFPGGSPASEAQARGGLLDAASLPSLPVHATQIYEAAGSFALAGFLMLHLHGKKRYDGQVFVVFLIAYAALRFVLEFFRADDRGELFGLSTSQWLGIAVAAVAVVIHAKRRGRLAAGTADAPA